MRNTIMRDTKILAAAFAALGSLAFSMSHMTAAEPPGGESAATETPWAPAAADTTEARILLGDVALRGDTILVGHDRDLWVLPRAGGLAARLLPTDARDQDGHSVSFPRYAPHFSPDGDRLAFSGGGDAYVLDRPTGAVRRLTYHPRGDRVRGWSPGGDTVYFASYRWKSGNNFQLHAIPAGGGAPRQLPLPFAFDGSVSPDGRYLAVQRFLTMEDWISYGGGMARPLEVVDRRSWSVVDTVPAGPSQDVRPAWLGEAVYFRSSRAANGESERPGGRSAATGDVSAETSGTRGNGGSGGFDLYRWRPGSVADPERLTHFPFAGVSAFGVAAPATGGGDGAEGTVVLAAGGRLHLLDPRTGDLSGVPLRFPEELAPVGSTRVPLAEWARSVHAVRDGALVVTEVRGDLFLHDREAGTVRRLIDTPGAREHGPALSPGGATVAYWSDASGEERLHLLSLAEGGETAPGEAEGPAPDAGPREIRVEEDPTRYRDLVWSPEGRRLAFSGERLGLWLLEVDAAGPSGPASGGTPRRIARSEFPGQGDWNARFSPDGRWLAYAKAGESGVRGVWLYHPETRRHVRVSDPLTSTGAPVFDPAGDRLYMAATDQAPLAVARDVPGWGLLSTNWASPLMSARLQEVHLSDLVTGREEGAAPAGAGTTLVSNPRVLPLPVARRDVVELDALRPGTMVVRAVAWPETPAEADRLPTPVFRWRASEPGEMDLLLEDADEVRAVPTGGSFLFRRGQTWRLARVEEDADAGDPVVTREPLEWEGDSVTVSRRAEWAHIQRDAWRRVATTYVGPERAALDLGALERHYAEFLPALRSRGDLNTLLQTGLGHLAWVSHLRVGGGAEWERPDVLEEPDDVPAVGLLGADLAPDGDRYRFTRIFRANRYSALFTEVVAPLDAAEVSVQQGEFLLAVDGTPVTTKRNPWFFLMGTAGEPTRITVGPNPDGAGSRTLTVRPVNDDRLIRETEWAEENRRLVEERSGGRVGYVWLKSYVDPLLRQMAGSLAALRDREALIVDHRWNGGGTTADALIEILGREPLYSYDFRHGRDLRIPPVLAPPQRVLIANQHDASAAETFTLMWKQAGLGPVVGTPTLGGLVGASLDQPPLIDGGRLLVPNRASRAPGLPTSELEGRGVPPDHFVDWTPADWQAGRDPQLEAALELLLEEGGLKR